MSSNTVIKDSLGKPIRVGSRISYPVRRGSDMWMQHGEVESFYLTQSGLGVNISANVRPITGSRNTRPERLVKFSSFDRAVVT